MRHDPFAMLPFCGYNMADYFEHWLKMGKGENLPKIYAVNWFRKSKSGDWLWPGFGENSRVLKWIFERCEGKAQAKDTPIGRLPHLDAFDVSGLKLVPGALEELFYVDKEKWQNEVNGLRDYFQIFGDRLPKAIATELNQLESRLKPDLHL